MFKENNHIIFETERLIVRRYTAEDADNFFLLNGDEEIMRYIRPAKPREETDQFLSEIIGKYKEDPSVGRWATEEKHTGIFIGSFAFIPVEGSDKMQLGYALLKQNWGRGFATELTMAGIQYVFTKTALTEIFAIAEAANISSQKVLLKAGFTSQDVFKEGRREMCRFVYCKKYFRP